jgi:uncharacterized protein (TIGR01440 family)
MLDQIKEQTRNVVDELLAAAKLEEGDIVIVGGSTSEVAAHTIGSHSSEEIGLAIFEVLYEEITKKNYHLAIQCCEHLNRAVIIEKTVAKEYGLTRVNVVPQLKAGGSLGTAAYTGMKEAVAVESLECKAKAGIDIGDTLIGMHMAPVVVPVRIKTTEIGSAHIVCARSRLKYIGGERAHYMED